MSTHQEIVYKDLYFAPEFISALNKNNNTKFTNEINLNNLFKQNSVSLEPSVSGHIEKKEENHDAQTFKQVEDINKLIKFFLSKKKYRNVMMFVCGFNFGLRISDLTSLKLRDIFNPDTTFKPYFNIVEKKTRNTKGKKKNIIDLNKLPTDKDNAIQYIIDKRDSEIDNSKQTVKPRTVYINEAVRLAISLYLIIQAQLGNTLSMDDYLFVAEDNCSNKTIEIEYTDEDGNLQYKYIKDKITRQGVDKIIKGAVEKCSIEGRYATHTFRKTFGYHVVMQEVNTVKNNNPNQRQLELLQSILKHSHQNTTLRYIGISEDEIKNTYENLNLGIESLKEYYNNFENFSVS